MPKRNLNTGQNNIIDRIFNSRAEELAQEKEQTKTDNIESFLDVVSNVQNESLKNQLRTIYLKEDEQAGEKCGKLIKKYYKNGFTDGVKLIISCVNEDSEK